MTKEKSMDYGELVDKAMKDIVRLALKKIEERPGEVCYLLVVDTKHERVVAPDYVKKIYPEEMTVLMKNKFSNFVLKEDYFEIDIKFHRKTAHLMIPIDAIVFFSDQVAGVEFKFAGNDVCEAKYEIIEEYEAEDTAVENEYSNNLINFCDLKKWKK
jgi:hypothetical protein